MSKTNAKHLIIKPHQLFLGVVLALVSCVSVLTFAQKKQPHPRIYLIDSSQSKINWSIDSHHGEVAICEGTIKTMENKIIDGHFVICMDSIIDVDIDYELMRHVLENTLKSKELFDATKYPHATFDVYSSKTISDSSTMIYGDLTIKGVEKCIAFEADTQFGQQILKAQSKPIQIDRTDWGITAMSINYSTSDEAYIVSDTITVQVSITAILSED